MINIRVDGLEKLKNAFQGASEKATKAVERAIKKAILLLQRESMVRTPVNTGRLRASHRVEFSTLRASLHPTVNYAPYVHEGTKAHIIVPIIKKALFWKGARHPVKRVRHPGTKARQWLLQAIQSSIAKIQKIFKEEIETIFK